MFDTCITRFADRHPMSVLWFVLAVFFVGGVIDTGSLWV